MSIETTADSEGGGMKDRFGNHVWDELAWIDAKCASMDAAAKGIPAVCPVCCAGLIAEGKAVEGEVCDGCRERDDAVKHIS